MDKRFAPTLILILAIFIILAQVTGLIIALGREGTGLFWILLLVLVPLIILGALISVYIERMKEIDEEEKDDLSKY